MTGSTAHVTPQNLVEARIGPRTGRRQGWFRRTGTTSWVEFGSSNEPRFRYEQREHTASSVLLHDSDRGVDVELDLTDRVMRVSVASGAFADGATIHEVRALRDEPATEPPLSGLTVNRVEFGRADAEPQGAFVQTGPHAWIETDSHGATQAFYVEESRHPGVVHLVDPSRDVRVGLHIRARGITWGDAATPAAHRWSILSASARVNGRTANRVVFRDLQGNPLGEYRQIGERTWVELDRHCDLVARFDEQRRDDWTVYLHDPKRVVGVTLNLHRCWVTYRATGSATDNDQHRIESATALVSDLEPADRPVQGTNAVTVHVGDARGEPSLTYRRVGEDHWVEVAPDGRVRRELRVDARGKDSIRLLDGTQPTVIDLVTRRVQVGEEDTRSTVLRASSRMTGHLLSEVGVGPEGGPPSSIFRQTGATDWAQLAPDGTVRAHYDEVRRGDWAVTIRDQRHGTSIEFDLRTRTTSIQHGKARPTWFGAIVKADVESDAWLHAEKLSSRSVLTHEYAPEGRDLHPRAVYRTSLRVSPMTRRLELWADAELDVTIDGVAHTLRPDVPVAVTPSVLRLVSVSVPATGLNCPAISVRTDLMMPDQRYHVLPDVEVHQKMANLAPGSLARFVGARGTATYSAQSLDEAQRVIQNLEGARQHTYNVRSFGVHHDCALLPANMEHPHFVLHAGPGTLSYQPLAPEEVPAQIAGARLVQASVGQASSDPLSVLVGTIAHGVAQGGRIVVHTADRMFADAQRTATNVAQHVVATAGRVGRDAEVGFQSAGEHLVHGDLPGAAGSLVQGGQRVGRDLTQGVARVRGDIDDGVDREKRDLAEGAQQVMVVTLHTAEEATQYLITHPLDAAAVVKGLFTMIGVKEPAWLEMLLDPLPWASVLAIQQQVKLDLDAAFDRVAALPARWKAAVDHDFATLTQAITADIDHTIERLDVPRIAHRATPANGYSSAAEQVEWLCGQLVNQPTSHPGIVPVPAGLSKAVTDLSSTITKVLGRDGGRITDALESAEVDLKAIFTNDGQDPDYVLGVILEIAKAAVTVCLDALNVIVDAMLEIMENLITWFRELIEKWPIPVVSQLYQALTGQTLSIADVGTLAVAIPAAMLTHDNGGPLPDGLRGVAAALTPLDAVEASKAGIYVGGHIVAGVFEPVNDGRAAFADAASALQVPLDLKRVRNIDGFATTFGAVLGAIINVAGTPVPVADSTFILEPPPDSHLRDVYAAPDVVAYQTLDTLWIGWVANVLLGVVQSALPASKSVDGRISPVVNLVFGAVVFGFMCSINRYDDRKVVALDLADDRHTTTPPTPASAYDDPDLLLAGLRAATGPLDPAVSASAFARYEAMQQAAADKAVVDALVPGAGWAPQLDSTVSAAGGSGFKATDFESTTSRGTQWMIAMLNYREWAREGQRTAKAFTNGCDAVPSIAKIGLLPPLMVETEGTSLAIAMGLELFGHETEAIGFLFRAAHAALL